MESVNLNDYQYLSTVDGKAHIVFFTAEGDLNFNINTEDGLENIKMIKEQMGLDDIGYLIQIHSDCIYPYDGQIHHGDALITDRKNIGIGVFTADCVPIMMYDRKKGIIAVLHSGWKGTYSEITSKTIDRMCSDFKSDPADIAVYIGPHNRQCCYEVGEEVLEKFREKDIYRNTGIIAGNKLSMEQCVIAQCLQKGILKENIMSTGICTYCSNEYKLHSYRRDKISNGRLFSMIFLKD